MRLRLARANVKVPSCVKSLGWWLMAAGLCLSCRAATTPRAAANVSTDSKGPATSEAYGSTSSHPASLECRNVASARACKLSVEDDARQTKILPGDSGRPGVCYEGACMPRGRCLRTCTSDIALRRFVELAAHFKRCEAEADRTERCAVEVIKDEDASKTGESVGQCFVTCGYDIPLDQVSL